MSVTGKRFEVAGMEFDIPTTDFKSLKANDLFNSPNLAIPTFNADTAAFVKNNVMSALPKPPSTLSDLTRAAKGAAGTLKDLSKLTTKDLDKALGGLLPDNPLVQNAFNKLNQKCKTKGTGKSRNGKPYDTDISCGGKKRKTNKAAKACEVGKFGDVLNKLSGGNYNAGYKDLNSVLGNLMSLANFGYSMDMCGILGVLGDGVPKNLMSRATGALLHTVGLNSNTFGVFDIAGAASGLHTLLENPKGITTALNNFKIPSSFKQKELPSLSSRYTGAMELLSNKWNTGTAGLLSTAAVSVKNKDLNSMFKSEALNSSVSSSALGAFNNSPIASMSAVMSNSNLKAGANLLKGRLF